VDRARSLSSFHMLISLPGIAMPKGEGLMFYHCVFTLFLTFFSMHN